MLMELHASRPFNPDIAHVFYRAGYIENRGRGIQKICDACAELGAPPPEYIVHGEDIMLKFTALESALIDQPKAPKYHNDILDDTLEDRIMAQLERDASITQQELASILDVSVPTIKRTMKELTDSGDIKRIGGKRYGYWQVNLPTKDQG